MKPYRVAAAVVTLAVVAALAWRLASGRAGAGAPETARGGTRTTAPSAPRDRTRSETPPATRAPAPEDSPSTPRGAADALRDALDRGDAAAQREAAAALRRAVRTDAESWRDAVRLLLADDTPAALRQAIALVLGTVADPDPDTPLLEALRRHGAVPEVARAVLLALGATRGPSDDDDVFGMGDRPWGAAGPGSLGIAVRRAIADAEVRGAVAACLRRDEPVVRRAAALALRHSLAAADARAAFTDALADETADVVAQELGEALVIAARSGEDAAQRDREIALVLRRASDDALDGLRFRTEDDLKETPLHADERLALTELAAPSSSFAKRSFALTVLAGSAQRGGDAAVGEARGLLVNALTTDADAAVRDLSARLLASVAPDGAALAALAHAAREDRAWNVRYTALSSLADAASPDVARTALTLAAEDADKRVADHARKLLGSLGDR